jgi:hypothetical protein
MSDAREIVEAIIDRILDEMELEAGIKIKEQENVVRIIEFETFDRMEFNWIEMDPIYVG